MSELIRREDVVEALYQAIRTTLTGTFTDSMSLAIAMANDIPSAEPERTKGKWIEYPDCLRYEGAYNDDHIVCSECGHVFSICNNCTEEFDFCPHCGADMRGE